MEELNPNLSPLFETLPECLLTEIFSRVPRTAQMRLQAVCRTWDRLIATLEPTEPILCHLPNGALLSDLASYMQSGETVKATLQRLRRGERGVFCFAALKQHLQGCERAESFEERVIRLECRVFGGIRGLRREKVLEMAKSWSSLLALKQSQIILLKEGTDTSQGKEQLGSNINACMAVADVVRTTLGTTLGPRGNTTISNDSATIMKVLGIVHPAAKILVDIAESQDSEVGDGTTTVVLLAGEFLKEAKPFIEDGVHPQILIQSFRTAAYLAIAKVKELAISIEGKSLQEKKRLLANCAATTLSSKLIGGEKEFFATLVVDAVLAIGSYDGLNMIGIKKVRGGNMWDSFLVNGVAFKKTFSYAGFEQQLKKFVLPKILLLNIELELKSGKENAKIRLSDPSQYQSIVDAEWNIIFDKLDKCVKSGAKIVLSRLAIGDQGTQYFADRDIFCAGQVAEKDLQRVAAATGGTVQASVNNIIDEVLGSCELFEERQVGNERFTIFSGCPSCQTATIVLRGGVDQFTERSLHDAIMIVRRAVQNSTVVAGGGAIDMEISRYLRQLPQPIAGNSQLFINSYAKALEVIPRQLCDNASFDVTDVLNKLRQKHALQTGEGALYGVDFNTGGIADTYANFVWEPAVAKINAIKAATKAACCVLSMDETVKNPESESAQGDAAAMGGRGRGGAAFRGRGGRGMRRR